VPFRPRRLVTELVELFRPEAEQRGNALTASIDDDVPDTVVGDPGRLRQILANLVSNAVKFTHGGSVTIRMAAETADSAVELRLDVEDTGIGMTQAQLERVFDPFRQADASTTRDYGGTGLGLTIARQLAAALDGQVHATSTPGVGSRFWFTSRFEATDGRDAPVLPLPEPTGTPHGHVLVVEDNETNQMVALGMLQALGYTADVAEDGEQGARLALTGAYDAVLMDLQMPGTDGFEGTRMIREAEGADVHLPVIALTASATDGERERCAAAGMDGFLSKPLVLETLAEELARCLPVVPAQDQARDRATSDTSSTTSEPADAVLDPDRLEELAEMGEAAAPLIRRAVENFIARVDEDVAELRRAAARHDHETLRMTAHRLKGSAANLGLVEVADVAFRLEELGRGRAGDPEHADPFVTRLEESLALGIRALRRHPVVLAFSDN
jgi:CheY-like chemotaxis protein/anti-sigma regulatory factor (Ser/Thr protein kinase)